MYSEQLESIIDAALADGVLTDKEREVLHKRAALEGVDPDELDVVIEGRLAKKKKEEDMLRPTPPQSVMSNKVGSVLKCPNCGADYQQGTIKCPECGHEFINRTAVSSAVQMNDGIQKIIEKFNNREKRESAIEDYILNFPIPSTRDDLIEFIPAMAARLHSDLTNSLHGAYLAKLKEAINKAKIFFPNDAQMQNVIKMHKIPLWKRISPSDRFGIVLWIIIALMFAFLGVLAFLEKRGYI